MGKLFIILGKSSSGKDTVYKRLCDIYKDALIRIVPFTTRPVRDGEIRGKDYNFVSSEEYEALKAAGRIVEERVYETVHGPWRYFTAMDDRLERVRDGANGIMIGTLEAFTSLKAFLGEDMVVPVYLQLEDGERLKRALFREMAQDEPRYKELCRRFLADCEDFSEEKLEAAGIKKRFDNIDLEECIRQCRSLIDEMSVV